MCKVSNCDGRTRKSVPETETNPRRVLYATDFSPEFQLPRFSSCTLPRMRTKTPLGPDAGRRLFPVALHVKHWLLEAGITLEYHVECRVPAEFIFEISEKLQIQLVVLGVRARYPRAAALLPEPTAYNMVSQAPCPVLVIWVDFN